MVSKELKNWDASTKIPKIIDPMQTKNHDSYIL